MTSRLWHFGFATLAPAALIALGSVWGGIWIFAAVIHLTAMTTVLDRLIKPDETAEASQSDTALSVVIAAAHFALLPLVIGALVNPQLGALEKIALFFAAGLWFGQVSNANAHELIHRQSRALHRLGMWSYITLLFGHHTSAHVLVHHQHVATRADPNTSRKGESLYRYMVRAWVGSFQQGYVAERDRLVRIERSAWRNPYVVYVGGAVLCLSVATLLGGWQALLAYVGLCGYAQSQLLMSDYVQHYGLLRATHANGKPEPVAAKHSWNSPHWFSSALMLNATRHSDHHAHPGRHYPALTLPKDAPMLPRPLPLMASIALIPPLWRRIMDPKVDRWRNA
ncbi:alkane 1-monooxygenase [Roseobacter sp. CCS2]|uniref:alkane 1-monooxygenase n=1 Tax=Roseobacter sp. CCS2 TaxID=391593 RepID=UPI0000F4049C|nr:alkane 1-monooxygenase [Roseobacter sp. CCS2]EBA12889.1 alkane-1 monooxygenase, putative [Roseobacter sp. CCS2]